jgi:ribosomal protein S18 acetylase RimI-like enzyme
MIDIRALGPDDLATLLGVDEGLFDNPLDPAESAAFLADTANLLLLAFDGDIAVGMLTATFLRHPDKPLSLFIAEVGTREGWERQGIATALVTRALGTARACGAHGVWLGTESDNAAAISLYRALGAKEISGLFFGWDGAFAADRVTEDPPGNG